MDGVMVGAAAAAAGGLSLLVWLVFSGTGARPRLVRANLNRGLEVVSQPRMSRLSVRRGGGIGRVLAHPRLVGHLDRLVAMAGRPRSWPVERVLDVKLLGGLVGLALAVLLVLRQGTVQTTALGVFLAVLGFFLPDVLLYNTAQKRRQAIGLELPDTLDQMSIAVDAGLAFDSAMLRVALNGRGVFAGELIRTLQDIQVGQPRRLAYESLAARCGVPELRSFIRSIIQAEEYGIALADVLKTQADEMRVERRQRAERKALELPVKMTFPLILFILPVLMIVILGPAAMNIMEAFAP